MVKKFKWKWSLVAMHVENFVAEPFMDKIMEFGGFVIKYW